MSLARQDLKHTILYTVHKTVSRIDPPAPESAQFTFQRLLLSDTVNIAALDVMTLPIEVMSHTMQRIVSFFPLTQGITMMKNSFLGIGAGSILFPFFVMLGVAAL